VRHAHIAIIDGVQDLATCVHGTNQAREGEYLDTEPFIDAVATHFEKVMKEMEGEHVFSQVHTAFLLMKTCML
jgi:hypothetical protein